MRKKMKLGLLVLLLSIFVSLNAPSYAVSYGGVLNVLAENEPDMLNPVLAENDIAAKILPVMMDGLCTLNSDLNFIPDLAIVVPTVANRGVQIINNKKMTVTYRLRDGVKWHDGQQLTSQDVKFTWQMNMKYKIAKTGYDKIARVETPDKLTVIVYFNEIYPEYNYLFNLILPKHCFLNNYIYFNKEHPYNFHPVGSGPFIFKAWDKGDRIVFNANPNYHLGKPFLGQIVIKFKNYNSYTANALESNKVQVIKDAHPLMYQALTNIKGVKVHKTPEFTIEQLSFNLSNKLLSNIWVRKGIAYAIDKKALNDFLFNSTGYEAYSDQYMYDPVNNQDLSKSYKYDIDKANNCLDRSGFTLNNKTRVNSRNEKLSFNLVTLNSHKRIAEYIKSSLKKTGIDIYVNYVPDWPSLKKELTDGTFDMALYNWDLGFSNDHYQWWSSNSIPPSGMNYTRFKDYQVDKLLKQFQSTMKLKDKIKIYRKISFIIDENLPALPLLYYPVIDAYSTKLHNFRPNVITGNFWNSYEWWLE